MEQTNETKFQRRRSQWNTMCLFVFERYVLDCPVCRDRHGASMYMEPPSFAATAVTQVTSSPLLTNT